MAEYVRKHVPEATHVWVRDVPKEDFTEAETLLTIVIQTPMTSLEKACLEALIKEKLLVKFEESAYAVTVNVNLSSPLEHAQEDAPASLPWEMTAP